MRILSLFCISIVFAQSESMILDCNYTVSSQDRFNALGSVYQCKVTMKSTVDKDQSNITNVTQNHLPEKTNKDVTFLAIRYRNLQMIPKGIESYFPNLKGIDVSVNKIKAICKDDLKAFPSLYYIDLYNNELTTLEGDLFVSTPNLQFINFGDNQIKIIGKNTFKPLKNLKELYFHDGSNCISDWATWRIEVETLISKLTDRCSPRTEMVQKVSDSQEDEMVQNDDTCNSMEENIEDLKNLIESLGKKTDSLMNALKNQVDSSGSKAESKMDSLKTQIETSLEGLKNQIDSSEKKNELKLNSLKTQIEYVKEKLENCY